MDVLAGEVAVQVHLAEADGVRAVVAVLDRAAPSAMWLWSLTAVSARMAVSMVAPKSRRSIASAMFIEPRLQEMSLPIWA